MCRPHLRCEIDHVSLIEAELSVVLRLKVKQSLGTRALMSPSPSGHGGGGDRGAVRWGRVRGFVVGIVVRGDHWFRLALTKRSVGGGGRRGGGGDGGRRGRAVGGNGGRRGKEREGGGNGGRRGREEREGGGDGGRYIGGKGGGEGWR